MSDIKTGLREVILDQEPKQEQVVDTITEDSPIIGNHVIFQAASNELVNKYEKIRDAVAPKRTDLAAPAQILTVISELKETKLFKIAGIVELPVDEIEASQPNFVERWLSRKLPISLRKGMCNIEHSYIYDSLLASCLAAPGRTVNMNTSASGSNYWSIIGVGYDAGENCGLYNGNRQNPQGGQAETFFRMKARANGGTLGLSNGAAGYVWDIDAMLGFQQASEKKLKAIVNIDDSHFPTYQQLIEFVGSIKGQNNARKKIFMHSIMRDKILSKYTRASGNDSYSSMIVVDAEGNIRIRGVQS